VVQFDREASQTRDYCVAKSATHRLRSGQAASRGSPRSFTAQRTLVQDDNQEVCSKMSTGLANPAEMIAHGAPRVIHNDAELEAYTDALFRLTALESPSRAEVEAIELLTLLVERYEQEHSFVPAADPVSVVRFLIERQNLTQRDLIPQFGSESGVSMFLTGKRKLTVEQVRKLSSRFKLPADVFIPKRNEPLGG
jgi:HTH-type transcriptional regulator/antitoxin HigA